MKLSDLRAEGAADDLSDAQMEANAGLQCLIDELGDLEIEDKDKQVWIKKAYKRNAERGEESAN